MFSTTFRVKNNNGMKPYLRLLTPMGYELHLPSLDEIVDGAGLGLSHPDLGEGLGLSHPPSLSSLDTVRGPLVIGVGVAVPACKAHASSIRYTTAPQNNKHQKKNTYARHVSLLSCNNETQRTHPWKKTLLWGETKKKEHVRLIGTTQQAVQARTHTHTNL